MKNKKSFQCQVQHFIETHQLIKTGDTVIIGVSGGADSVALLSILNDLRHELGITLHIAHFNHKLRKSADTDQCFVEKLAKQFNVPITIGYWKHSKNSQEISEDLARQQRLKFFQTVLKKTQATSIALAHHMDDLAETILMRIVRGSGLQGMRGILPKRIIDGMTIIRPLLDVSREEINQYLHFKQLTFRTDPTNKKNIFFRNKIRLNLLPEIEKTYNPSIKKSLNNLANNVMIDYDFLEQTTQKSFNKISINITKKSIELKLTSFKKEHLAIQRLLFRKSYEMLTGNSNQLTLTHMQEIEDLIQNRPIQSIIDLPQNIAIQKTESSVLIYKKLA